jgi:hypothetical protein
MTLIELSVIILVLLTFISLSFVGVRAWKRGSDRAGCIMNIRQVQQAVRGYANTNNLAEGTDTDLLTPAINLQAQLIGTGKYLEQQPLCPGNGLYHLGGNLIPPRGMLYMTCTLAGTDGHVPDDHGSW